jgi:hypothetical protein
MADQRFAILSLATLMLCSGCYSSLPGVVHASDDNPIAVVGAGEIDIGSGAHYYARYLVDRRAGVCWFFAGDSVAPMDCCALQRVGEARPFLNWMDRNACPTSPSASSGNQTQEAGPSSTTPATPPTGNPTSPPQATSPAKP